MTFYNLQQTPTKNYFLISLCRYNVVENKHVTDLRGHEDAVNAVIFDSHSRFLVSASSDGFMQIWSPQ
jgi:WD40 repeat protein